MATSHREIRLWDTGQAALRHSSLHLTMNVYTAPTPLDVAGAMKVLPELSLTGQVQADPAKRGKIH